MSSALFTITPPRDPQDGPGYAVSVGVQEILGWGLEAGMSEDELRERCEEAVDAALEADR